MGKIPWGQSVLKAANDADAALDSAMDMDDAHPAAPFHHVLRERGFKPSHSEHVGGERHNYYTRENPGGGKETVKAEITQRPKPGGNKYGEVNTHTSSDHPDAITPRVNNSPEKLDRNIHTMTYRTPEGTPSKHKPAEIKEHATKMYGKE